jgi:hypothetical protein
MVEANLLHPNADNHHVPPCHIPGGQNSSFTDVEPHTTVGVDLLSPLRSTDVGRTDMDDELQMILVVI